MPNRIRFYPYKVTYIDLHDYMAVPNGQKLPVFTDIIRAKTSEDAKNLIRANTSRTVAFMTSGRYPERLGTSVKGIQLTTLTKQQLKALEEEVHNGSAKLPHRVDPKAFVASNPNSTIHTRPTPPPTSTPRWPSQRTWASKSDPIGAPRTAMKSTPIPLSASVLDVGGFTVGYKKPGDEPTPTPTVARPTPQPDIYGLAPSTPVATPTPAPPLVDLANNIMSVSGKWTQDVNGNFRTPIVTKPSVSPFASTTVAGGGLASAAATAPALESHPLTTGPAADGRNTTDATRIWRDKQTINFKYMSPAQAVVVLDSTKIDQTVTDALNSKAIVQNEPIVVTADTPHDSVSCCERDDNGDGNCDQHSAPSVYRALTPRPPLWKVLLGMVGLWR